jgi:hypothetical protein
MSAIEITMKSPTSTTTSAIGEIFANPRGGGGPVVNDVNVHAARTSRCQLPTGSYTYAFHVEGDGGKFTLEIFGTGSPATPTRTVDTSFGFSGWTFDFTVL